ncbi:uncharacterized protein LOC144651608 [Oculina patagonica]
MPHWCIAYGCTNSSDMEDKKSWHRLSLENKELLSKWIAKIRRTNTPVNEHSRICGDHFEAECFTKKPGSSRVNLKTGSIPTKFCFVQEKEPRKPPKDRKPVEKQQKISDKSLFTEGADDCIENDIELEESNEEHLKRRIKELEQALESEIIRRKTAEAALEAKRFSVKNLLKDPKVFKFYTGFTEEQFYCLLEFLGDGMNNLTYWGTSSASNSNSEDLGGLKPGPSRKLTTEDELLLVLTRLRVGMLEQDLAVRFEMSQSHVSRIITTWVNAMYHRFKEIDIWPTREQSIGNLPEKVKEFCLTLRCIIDATEIYIEQPKNPEAQQLTFSTYKNHNTLKSLIGISGDGAVNFVSTLEGGSISDRDLTVRCGILSKDWAKGDVLMADRGFEIQDDLALLGVKLNIPPFYRMVMRAFDLKGKGQFEEDELVETRRIAKFRIHVERAIERIKNYHILDYVPVTLCSSGVIDQIFFVCAMLTNFLPPLVSDDKDSSNTTGTPY